MPELDLNAVDETIHGRLRLGIMAILSTLSPISFPDLAQRTGATHGNLSTHLGKLEEAGYVHLEKGYAGKKPRTLIHLTVHGREAWIRYLDALRPLLNGG